MQIPIYSEEIIVGVIYKRVFNWYITNTELWYLDYGQAGYSVEEYPEERNNINVLNEDTASTFFENIEKYRISTNLIKKIFLIELNKDREETIYNYNPSLLIDFDKQIFYSNYPEAISFEEYIPDNWTGYFQSFLGKIPSKYRYWEENGMNYLTRKD